MKKQKKQKQMKITETTIADETTRTIIGIKITDETKGTTTTEESNRNNYKR